MHYIASKNELLINISPHRRYRINYMSNQQREWYSNWYQDTNVEDLKELEGIIRNIEAMYPGWKIDRDYQIDESKFYHIEKQGDYHEK